MPPKRTRRTVAMDINYIPTTSSARKRGRGNVNNTAASAQIQPATKRRSTRAAATVAGAKIQRMVSPSPARVARVPSPVKQLGPMPAALPPPPLPPIPQTLGVGAGLPPIPPHWNQRINHKYLLTHKNLKVPQLNALVATCDPRNVKCIYGTSKPRKENKIHHILQHHTAVTYDELLKLLKLETEKTIDSTATAEAQAEATIIAAASNKNKAVKEIQQTKQDSTNLAKEAKNLPVRVVPDVEPTPATAAGGKKNNNKNKKNDNKNNKNNALAFKTAKMAIQFGKGLFMMVIPGVEVQLISHKMLNMFITGLAEYLLAPAILGVGSGFVLGAGNIKMKTVGGAITVGFTAAWVIDLINQIRALCQDPNQSWAMKTPQLIWLIVKEYPRAMIAYHSFLVAYPIGYLTGTIISWGFQFAKLVTQGLSAGLQQGAAYILGSKVNLANITNPRNLPAPQKGGMYSTGDFSPAPKALLKIIMAEGVSITKANYLWNGVTALLAIAALSGGMHFVKTGQFLPNGVHKAYGQVKQRITAGNKV